ncbi:NAD(P)H-hydrate dehydratase [filamentous cyanobacterium LEGE 11480]|uniref:Bifunctional NAD(P)H-hydrate repair enzyme n=2 Tax=Romeriopsis TaxID=2992131 RepID=A0A928Z3T8_9CYAN|nr:NAD(P)H-hydrate dehydratase [Romeriopsis navalis LEGE 11480]
MQAIEARIFAADMPVAALMEKVALQIAAQFQVRYPLVDYPQVGVLVGPGHNGGDALVVARELHFRGYGVQVYCPFERLKDLTQSHLRYATTLGIPVQPHCALADCDVWLDGLFGFGQSRNITGTVAQLIDAVNATGAPIISIDLPSGIQPDTGQVLGTAIRATVTLCLGLWKQAFFQEAALPALGESTLVDFDIPAADITAVMGSRPLVQRVDHRWALAALPLQRPLTVHKYQMGNLLLVCGSTRYAGAAILAGLGARASGVGMLSIAVPAALKPLLNQQLPEALIIPCSATATGEIQALPASLDLAAYSTIGCGCGLTQGPQAVVEQVLAQGQTVVLDADGLNIVAAHPAWLSRAATTVLTPHVGEFRRLFPAIDLADRLAAVRAAALQSRTIVLLKGARVAIAAPSGQVGVIPESTPALARGGSGDVLTGLLAGLLAQSHGADPVASSPIEIVQAAAWWHAQTGRSLVVDRTQLGVDAETLAIALIPALKQLIVANSG